MRRLKELDEMRPDLERWVEGMAGKMGESAMVLSIFTKDYKNGIDSLLQFAVAVMMDKPLYLLVPEGEVVPEKVKRIADGIVFYKRDDTASMHAASQKLLQQAQSKHFPT